MAQRHMCPGDKQGTPSAPFTPGTLGRHTKFSCMAPNHFLASQLSELLGRARNLYQAVAARGGGVGGGGVSCLVE